MFIQHQVEFLIKIFFLQFFNIIYDTLLKLNIALHSQNYFIQLTDRTMHQIHQQIYIQFQFSYPDKYKSYQ